MSILRNYDIFSIEERVHNLEVGGSPTPGGGSWDYSTNEVDTNQKWVDGKEIYCKVLQSNITGAISVDQTITVGELSDVETIIDMFGVVKTSSTSSPTGTLMDTGWIDSTGSVKLKPHVGYNNITDLKTVVFYTKTTLTKSTKRSKK